jgi:signal transduction histidine kinase
VQLIDFNGDLCMLAVIKDVTQEKKLEAELARIDRLNLIGEMAASIGHEIRNPITAVRGFLQILKDEPVCHEYHGFYELMMEELDRANGILSNFLNISRDKTVELKPGSLDNVVMTLQPMIQAEALMNDKEVNMLLGGTPLLMIEEKEIVN